MLTKVLQSMVKKMLIRTLQKNKVMQFKGLRSSKDQKFERNIDNCALNIERLFITYFIFSTNIV